MSLDLRERHLTDLQEYLHSFTNGIRATRFNHNEITRWSPSCSLKTTEMCISLIGKVVEVEAGIMRSSRIGPLRFGSYLNAITSTHLQRFQRYKMNDMILKVLPMLI